MATSIQPGTTAMEKTSLFTVSATAHVTLYGSVQMPQRRRRHGEGGGGGHSTDEEEAMDPRRPNDHPVLKLDSLKSSLHTVERAVTQNVYQPKQARYRDLPVLVDPDQAPTALDGIIVQAPHLEKLWGFKCSLAKGLCVTSMAWNPANLVGAIPLRLTSLPAVMFTSSNQLS